MTLRGLVLFLLIGGGFALILNFFPLRYLWKLHPRRRRVLIAAATIGNAMWFLVPFAIRVPSTEFSRLLRAVVAPVWCAWIAFLLAEIAFLSIAAILWLLLFSRRRTFVEFLRPLSAPALAVMAVMFVVGVYQALVPLRVEHVRIAVRNLPAELEGTRIAQMSDLHVGWFTRMSRLERFAKTINAAAPDVVVISGDLIDDDPEYVPKLLAGAAFIDAKTPIAAVLGNHEMYGDPHAVIRNLSGSRIRLLVNEAIPVARNGRRIWIAGISDFASERARSAQPALHPDIDAALRNIPLGEPRILLAHQPLAFALARTHDIPLTLVGHTHGGQFGLRFLHWSLAGVFLPFDMGLYRRGEHQLYVNTGTGYWAFPFRFGMTPEITILELHRAQ